jgi:hypothetical protein
MDRIINDNDRTLEPMTEDGLTGITSVIDSIIESSTVVTTRERLGRTKRHIESKRRNWLALRRLDNAYWLHGDDLRGTCSRWKYSRWYSHISAAENFILAESSSCESAQTTYNEWTEIMRRSKLIFDSTHFFVSKVDLSSDFRLAFKQCLDIIHNTYFPLDSSTLASQMNGYDDGTTPLRVLMIQFLLKPHPPL